uniref:Complement receptor type 1 n=1 Tax=Ciona intestinalis TaxID=7719 RepID=H2XL19_CIOIN|nr:complement receptor type 1 [Ciona intestinalis]|eukprot:XP_002125332.1 complement receptor type 1 [Ciona intestinalis]
MSGLTWIAIVGLVCIHLAPCEGNIWDSRPKFCSPPIPTRPVNGGFKCRFANNVCVGGRYNCRRGYKLQGAINYNACFNGTWLFSSPPRCVEDGCNAPRLRNGDYRPRSSNHRERSVITIKCKAGYTPRSQRSTCRRRYGSYRWIPSPYCGRDAKCDPPSLQNGNYSPLKSKYNRNTAITVTCSPGYKTRSRDSLSYCRGNSWVAHWRPLPFCYSTCPPPTPPVNGRMEPTSQTTWLETDRVSFYCGFGFTLVGADAATCRANGQWDNAAPTCAEEAVVEGTTGSGDA